MRYGTEGSEDTRFREVTTPELGVDVYEEDALTKGDTADAAVLLRTKVFQLGGLTEPEPTTSPSVTTGMLAFTVSLQIALERDWKMERPLPKEMNENWILRRTKETVVGKLDCLTPT